MPDAQKSRFTISILPGDGIGPEIVREAQKVLGVVADAWRLELDMTVDLVGGASIDACGVPITDEVLERAKAADAVLLGAVGGAKWDALDSGIRPEKALFALRKGLGLFANLRPVSPHKALVGASTLKPAVLAGVDLLVVRELTGGLYFGEPRYRKDHGYRGDVCCQTAVDTLVYTTEEIERIAKRGFNLARARRRKVTSVDKANVLESSRLWRETVSRVAEDYPDVELSHMLVDNCAMQLIRWPAQFDVIVTENLFGDILSDEAAMLTGSIGMLPSASLGDGSVGLYEPIHGSAPDIAGQDIANPIATILSAAMMLRISFNLDECASGIEAAVSRVLAEGYRTTDIMSDGMRRVGTQEMGQLVLDRIDRPKMHQK